MKNHLIYKITNIVNNKIYIGKHSTDNIEDGYMGSGTYLNRLVNKYGVDKFKKKILYNFDIEEDAYLMETKIVNKEFVKRKDTYNIKLGGEGGWAHSTGTTAVKDKDGNTFRVSVNDLRFLSGELVGVNKGKVSVRDENGNTIQTDLTNPRYLSGEWVSVAKNTLTVKDKDGNTFNTFVDSPRYLSGEWVSIMKGRMSAKDKYGNIFNVSVNDPRRLSGELVGMFTGKHHSEETKQKMSKSSKGKSAGKLNSQYGTCWVYSEEYKQSKKIMKEDLWYWLDMDWKAGRKMKF